MRDSIITARWKKIELIAFGCCFLLANIVNVIAILCYGTRISELVTELPRVIILTFPLYIVWWICKGIFHVFKLIIQKK